MVARVGRRLLVVVAAALAAGLLVHARAWEFLCDDAYISFRYARNLAEHGALEYRECVGDDLNIKGMLTFPKLVKPRNGETVLFSWIVYKSKAHRDRVMAKVMKDPRLASMMDPKNVPFDVKRMACGGFKIIVES